MKITQLNRQAVLERMGDGYSEAEADAMLRILQRSEFTDTHDISDDDWQQMVAVAVSEAV